MRKILTILFLCAAATAFGQSWSQLDIRPEYKNGIKTPRLYLKRQDLTTPTDTAPHIVVSGDALKLWSNGTYRDVGTGGSGGTVPSGPITSAPTVGFDPGTTDPATWITKTYYQSQNPTATLSGGVTQELMSAGAALSYTLNWSAGRQSATAPLASIVVAGVSQSIPTGTPTPGNSNFGSQNVSVTRNTNTTYSNVVTATDSKSTTATTSFTFLPKRYFGWVSSTSPSDADIIAAGGELSTAIAKSWTQAAPSGSQYLMYAFPASEGSLTHFDINSFPSISAMQMTTRNVTNASGYTQQYRIYVSINAFNVTGTTTIAAD